ncbi:hypothetical protein [Kitasatospora purpeofusca]|uniref:hypothetical protein n=1 Tax=Kitasatospora purpeofusca TaxID=67352 RepID=UPI0036767B51
MTGAEGPTKALAAAPATKDYYASPTGTGTACTAVAPCSLVGARDLVRSLAPRMASDIRVLLRGGTYRLDRTFELAPQDSGTGGHTVHWQAYPGEEPVLSGARKVTGWSLVDAGTGLHRAAVPSGTESRQLYVDGVRAERTRSEADPGGFTRTATGFTTSDGRYTSWRNPADVEVVGRNAWKHLRCPVARIGPREGGGSEFVMAQPCWGDAGRPPYASLAYPESGSGYRGFGGTDKADEAAAGIAWIENAYENLSRPGQFYLDRSAGQLYYIPRPGEDLASADVELPVLEGLVQLAGTPGPVTPVNSTDPRATYSGSWDRSAARPYGDLDDDVQYTSANGASVAIAFDGTGIAVLGERFKDSGDIDVYVDGAFERTVALNRTVTLPSGVPERLARQTLFSKAGLRPGPHTVTIVKKSGGYLTVDAFAVTPDVVAPVHDITLRGITFSYATWLQPSGPDGYRDNQAGVLWAGAPARAVHTPGAVRVVRGSRIGISDNRVRHVGGVGVELAAGTQDSTVTGNGVDDTAGGGISVGEFDDFWQTDPTHWTRGNTVADNAITRVGQDYEDAVGILVGYATDTTVAHNEVARTPYTGISLGWGWCWADRESYGAARPRHGTSYAGNNRILDNYVHDVMRVLHDGAGIYTLGSQGFGPTRSVLAGNVVSLVGGHGIYHDEDSTYWDTHHNVVTAVTGAWVNLWQASISDNTVHDNHTDTGRVTNHGTRSTVTGTTTVTDGRWPAAARAIVAAAGLEPAHADARTPEPITGNDSQTGDLLAPVTIAYTGTWTTASGRTGNLLGDAHITTAEGAGVTFTFTGTGLRVIGEKAPDQGLLALTVDGIRRGTVDTRAPARTAQAVIAEASGLPAGRHTLTLVKQGGTVADQAGTTARIDGYTLLTNVS